MLLTVALFSWFSSQYWLNQRIHLLLQDLQQQSQLVAMAASRELQNHTRTVENIAVALAGLSSTQQLLRNPRMTSRFNEDLQHYSQAFGLEDIWLVDGHGKVFAYGNRLPSSVNQALPLPPGKLTAILKDGSVHRFALDPDTGKPAFYYAFPLTRQKRIVAALIIKTSPNEMTNLVLHINTLVTDSDGVILLADKPEWMLHPLTPLLRKQPQDTLFPLLQGTSPLLPDIQLFGPQRLPIVQYQAEQPEADYRVHAIADAQPVYTLAENKDRLSGLVAVGVTGSLWGLILTVLTLKRNKKYRATMSRANDELVRLNQQLKSLATTDFLTYCPNRRSAETRLQQELANARRYGSPLCILTQDLDYFKHINDQYGHDVGDQVLQHFAKHIREAIRDTDLFARTGGEEFLLILPQTTLQQALPLTQRLLDNISATPLYLVDKTVSISFSGGLIQAHEDETMNELLARADRALYSAKEAGRCRIHTE
ncbi:sensor domain-containing diguanylate cyclase [Zobellella maritima]|uniref:sensor domain-containing diguanylate cyclase n=1 Tax=Zobellella maritima TaxID=2059725 RepID=UPI00130074C4|nr:sensor domain-containing diguanylate cyclase [Zobellella maritima]